MQSSSSLKFVALAPLLIAVSALIISCGGSKANVRKTDSGPDAARPAIEVTTASAIKRELPRYFEATGSLAGDQQTDVAPQTSGKIVAVCVWIRSPGGVRRILAHVAVGGAPTPRQRSPLPMQPGPWR